MIAAKKRSKSAQMQWMKVMIDRMRRDVTKQRQVKLLGRFANDEGKNSSKERVESWMGTRLFRSSEQASLRASSPILQPQAHKQQ